MATLYVTEVGTQVRKVGERLLLCKGKDVVEEIPLIHVDQVVMVGRGVSLTTAAMFALIQKGVDIIYLSGAGRFVSRVMGSEHKNIRLRHAQALAVADPARAFSLASAIVQGKINNQRALVRRHAGGMPWSAEALNGMDQMMKRAAQARGLDELRGLEGQAAKEYFALLRRLLERPRDGVSWGFDRRSYYPPTDPINALLSFGYTLLLNDMVAACQMVGLDPYLGCFHVIDYGRPSMALDLIEEFRPVIVDSILLQVVNRRLLLLQDFEQKERVEAEEDSARSPEGPARPAAHSPEADQNGPRPVYLNAEGRKKFLVWYEQRVNEQVQMPISNERTTYRRVFLLQAQQAARMIQGQAETYQPFVIR